VKRIFGIVARLGNSGSVLAEFSLVVPILLLLIFGIFQVGVLFLANAGLKHGLGEAARLASLFPARSDAEIAARVANASFGIDRARLAEPVITHGISQGAAYTEISVRYTVPMNIVVVTLPSITLTDRRRVFVP